jgi:hypothetical protein
MGIANLQLLHGSDVSGLDVVLVLLDLLLELIGGDLLVLNDKVDLELLNTESEGNELRGTPDEAVLLNGADIGLHGGKISLVI